MIETAANLGLAFVDRYGVVALLVAFALEGALVGKVLPTRTLFVGVVLAMGTALVDYAAVFAAAVLGATAGQLLLFLAVRRLGFDPAASDRIPIGERRLDRAEGWLDRWGPAAVACSNVLPLARGSLTVPTAMGSVPATRFTAYSLVGTTGYVGALVGLALGIDALIPWSVDAASL